MRTIKPFIFAVLAGAPLAVLPAMAQTTITQTNPDGKVYSQTGNSVETPNSQQPAVGSGRADAGATAGAEGGGGGGGAGGAGGGSK